MNQRLATDFQHYSGSILLGLSDGLVEILGSLAGLTLAFQNSVLIITAIAITCIAASFSMGTSEYLSELEEGRGNALKHGLSTSVAYMCTALCLTVPYFFIKNSYLAFLGTLFIALSVLFAFSYYDAQIKKLSVRRKFISVAVICLGVGLLNFIVASVIKKFLLTR